MINWTASEESLVWTVIDKASPTRSDAVADFNKKLRKIILNQGEIGIRWLVGTHCKKYVLAWDLTWGPVDMHCTEFQLESIENGKCKAGNKDWIWKGEVFLVQ